MQKIDFSPSYPRNERTERLAFYLATVLCLGLSLPAPVRAEGGRDLNITKDGGNVNVNLNTATSSDVSIRRSDDIMVIKVPKSYKGNVNIDPALKKNSVVHEEEIPSGRAITIQSQQIYLHTWDGDANAPASQSINPHADKQGEKQAGKATTEIKPSTETESKDDASPTKEGILKLSPHEGNGGDNNPAESADSQPVHTSSKLQRHHHHAQAEATVGHAPLDINRWMEQDALLSKPFAPAPETQPVEGHTSTHPTSQHSATSNSKKLGKVPGRPEQVAVPENESPSAKEDLENSVGDPEQESLDSDSKLQAAAMQASINGLLRIFFSLLLVLGLVIGFIKGILPKLLERYPDFFEKLKEHKQWSTDLPGQMNNSWLRSSSKQATKPVKPKPLSEPGRQTFEHAESPKSTSKKNYLERLKMGGEHLQVLETTELGKGKELHLVLLNGKQFLVATTPYTVTLLKEVSEESSTVFSPDSIAPKSRQIAEERAMSMQQPAHHAIPQSSPQARRQAEPKISASVESVSPVQSQTIAYLSDQSPIQRVRSVKPYATQPVNPQRRKPSVPQFPAPPDEMAQPYVTRPTQSVNSYPAMFPNAPVVAENVASTSSNSYIDAEEVVVLEDYEDVFGR